MTCRSVGGAIVCDFTHGEGSAVVNKREWRWEFHDYLGPTFLRKDGVPLSNQMPPQAVWDAFDLWLRQYRAARATPVEAAVTTDRESARTDTSEAAP